MFCIGAPTCAQRLDELRQSRARPMPNSACAATIVLGERGPGERHDGTAANRRAASGTRSEITGPCRVARTVRVTAGAPLIRMTSSRVSKGARPPGVR